jgi:hypothetical protein
MKKQVLFVFEFDKRTPAQVSKTNRELFGYLDQSLHGKYVYKRKGLLSDYNIQRITKGALLTDEVNQQKVQEILKSKGTKKIKRYFLTVDKVIG